MSSSPQTAPSSPCRSPDSDRSPSPRRCRRESAARSSRCTTTAPPRSCSNSAAAGGSSTRPTGNGTGGDQARSLRRLPQRPDTRRRQPSRRPPIGATRTHQGHPTRPVRRAPLDLPKSARGRGRDRRRTSHRQPQPPHVQPFPPRARQQGRSHARRLLLGRRPPLKLLRRRCPLPLRPARSARGLRTTRRGLLHRSGPNPTLATRPLGLRRSLRPPPRPAHRTLPPHRPTLEGPLHFAGDHTSLKPAWIEGAPRARAATSW